MVIEREHLDVAWSLVKRGTPASGIDGMTPSMFQADSQVQLTNLYQQLRQEIYFAKPALGFNIRKKSGGTRQIGISTVRDRVVQRYLLQSLYPAIEQTLSPASHAYRLGLSIYSAIKRIRAQYRATPAWVVQADIHHFFDQISWPLLFSKLDQLYLPHQLPGLIEQQVTSGIVLTGQYYRPSQGLIQGSILSGALANLYLSDFDAQCLDAGLSFVRYGDDCLVICETWLQATKALHLIEESLASLYLTLHPEKSQIFEPTDEFTYLGHQFSQGEIRSPPRSRSAKPRKPKPKSAGYGRPKACALKQRKTLKRKPSKEYWRDGMTTLYITEQGAYVKVKNKQFQVFYKGELRCAVPVNRVTHIVLFGCCNLSHGAVSLALRRRIPIMYLSHHGSYFGRLETSGQALVKYLTRQVECAQDPDFRLQQAQVIITAKIRNSRTLLQRLNRRRSSETAQAAIQELSTQIKKIPEIESIDELYGHEGHAAKLYFQAYASLLKGEFTFEKRTRRPPTDPINSLLSLGYTLLSQNVHSMVEAVGLHTHFGNLHAPRKNHPALICDLVEEFRAMFVDSLVAYLINSNIFKADDFTPPDHRGGVYLHHDALRTFLKYWEERLQTEITHPHSGHKVNYRRCIELQVREYVSCLMGDQPVYRPMVWTK